MRKIRLSIISALLWMVLAAGSFAQEAAQRAALGGLANIRDIASKSECAAYSWKGRGKPPAGYIPGVAQIFARAVCHPERADVQVASSAAGAAQGDGDGLVVYQQDFEAAGMRNDVAGVDTLRHAYTLLVGLGMRESSGEYCEGRDVSACFNDGNSAEAGLFQTSYGAQKYSPSLGMLFARYTTDKSGCLRDEFKGIVCRVRKSQNPHCPDADSNPVGQPPGLDWQKLTKSCPAFAIEFGVVVLRTHAGPTKENGEFGPIIHHQVELHPNCDLMLRQVQAYVEKNPSICSAL
ncbi:hypothetical protein DFR50_116100 [Roseiarcus fermentans]|uniref:Uncharacterized protein n=1 Tax=Roseiarcus fermentans TaxID=1473586 RepID=A0A366FCH3_9HYPH|nr:hypothetical protein [Roseiarcus fermentans]RBP11405.1 hypothetical protein DFR50_116100 [Roseiarcus fermentans]